MNNARNRRAEHLVVVPHAPGRTVVERPRGVEAPIDFEEVMIGGRRYRLVPVDRETASAGRAAPSDASRQAPSAGVVPRARASAADALTARELEIARLVAEGRVNKQIAGDLRISEWTVATHLRRMFVKLGVDTRAAMVSRCFEAIRGG